MLSSSQSSLPISSCSGVDEEFSPLSSAPDSFVDWSVGFCSSGFSPGLLWCPWTYRTCCFKFSSLEQPTLQRGHLCNFSFSCTDLMCNVSDDFCPKLLSHKEHLCGLRPSWTVCTCCFKCGRLKKFLEQTWQLCSFRFSWTSLTCASRCCFCLNVFSQMRQLKAFLFSCTFSWCLFSEVFAVKFLPQIRHVNSLILQWTTSMWTFKSNLRLHLSGHRWQG